jgi:uncharacterized protein involved in exopolysaccharide biosynthesis
MPAPNYNLFDLIDILLKWKKPIILTCVAAALISSVVSFLIPVYYKSKAVFYPYDLKSIDPRYITSDKASEIFGTDDDLDRFISIGQSSEMENMMVSRFDLFKRYEVDSSEKYARTNILEELRSNFTIMKNERAAIEVTVYDKNPKIAAQMANEAVILMDQINKRSIMEKNKKVLTILKNQIDTKYMVLDSILKSVKMTKREEAKKSSGAKQYFDELKNIDVRLSEDYLETLKMKEQYETAISLYNSNLSSIMMVEEASPAEKKSRPVRWLIVISSTIGAFMLVCLLAIFIELYKNESRVHEDRA